MYLIQYKTGKYLKLTLDNKIIFTANENLAEIFSSEQEAIDFIRKAFIKRKRKSYKVIYCEGVSNLTETAKEEKIDDRYEDSIEGFYNVINTYLNPDIEQRTQQLRKYDDMILDIRHYLRDKDTKLNACQGYKTMVVLQKLERERASCKKELKRATMLKSSVLKAVTESETFDYEKYKNRCIENVAEYILANQ